MEIEVYEYPISGEEVERGAIASPRPYIRVGEDTLRGWAFQKGISEDRENSGSGKDQGLALKGHINGIFHRIWYSRLPDNPGVYRVECSVRGLAAANRNTIWDYVRRSAADVTKELQNLVVGERFLPPTPEPASGLIPYAAGVPSEEGYPANAPPPFTPPTFKPTLGLIPYPTGVPSEEGYPSNAPPFTPEHVLYWWRRKYAVNATEFEQKMDVLHKLVPGGLLARKAFLDQYGPANEFDDPFPPHESLFVGWEEFGTPIAHGTSRWHAIEPRRLYLVNDRWTLIDPPKVYNQVCSIL